MYIINCNIPPLSHQTHVSCRLTLDLYVEIKKGRTIDKNIRNKTKLHSNINCRHKQSFKKVKTRAYLHNRRLIQNSGLFFEDFKLIFFAHRCRRVAQNASSLKGCYFVFFTVVSDNNDENEARHVQARPNALT